jgi:hypothetical protein
MNLNLMDPKFIMLAGVVILVIAVLAWMYMRKRRGATADLRQRFGPEYERAVLKHGSERKAEAKLVGREKRVEKLNLRDLDLMEHERFLKRWESVQSRFVDSPKGAVTEGDDLVSSLMKTRGYPRDTSSTPQPTSEAPAQRLHPICSFRMYFASAVSST